MAFGGISYLAVLIAAIAAFVFGAVYYGALGKPWMKAARIDPAQANMSPVLFITSFAAELVMAWVLAGVIGHLGTGEVTLWNGVVSGLFVWLGFMATTVAVNQRYQGFGWDLTLIDAGHWLGVAVIMGAVIGWWGV
ncbi:MAG: DUF1761 domain-containing protein [Rhizobiaceae bacterium]